MKLENQVASLELCERLKELGVKQDSLEYWFECPIKNIWVIGTPRREWENYSAFTVAELGELLPTNTQPLTYWIMKISTSEHDELWQADLLYNRKSLSIFNSSSEAGIRAEMLIYLIENKLIEVPK